MLYSLVTNSWYCWTLPTVELYKKLAKNSTVATAEPSCIGKILQCLVVPSFSSTNCQNEAIQRCFKWMLKKQPDISKECGRQVLVHLTKNLQLTQTFNMINVKFGVILTGRQKIANFCQQAMLISPISGKYWASQFTLTCLNATFLKSQTVIR